MGAYEVSPQSRRRLLYQPISVASRPRDSCDTVTARMSAPPLKTLVTQSGMPSMVRPVMPVARK